MKQISNYTKYSISPCGTIVLNTENNKQVKIGEQIIKGRITGYKYVTLYSGYTPKRIAVHRLVAFTYLEAPKDNQLWINHIDGNKSNNNANNLEWTTISENIQHAHDNGLRVTLKGEDSPIYGMKRTKATKKKQSEAKQGKKHPKFSGYYIVHHLKYESAPIAAKACKENSRTIIRKCKAGTPGTEYYFVKVEQTEFYAVFMLMYI